MGLLDRIMNATDNGGSFTYLPGSRAGTRNVCKVVRIVLDDPSDNDKVTKVAFKVDAEVLFSDHPDFGTHLFPKNSVMRINPPSNYTDSLLATARRFILASATSKEGKAFDAALGLTQNQGEGDKAFASRVGAEYKRLCGETQPLQGALVTVIATMKGNDPSKKGYTLYEGLVPSADDLTKVLGKAA